jgi:putative lumazine-binding protein
MGKAYRMLTVDDGPTGRLEPKMYPVRGKEIRARSYGPHTGVLMHRRLGSIGVAGFLILATGAWAIRARNEEAAVRAALEHYLQGHATGDGAHFSVVFHPDSKLFWVRDGQLMQRTSADYIAGAPGKPAADEAQRKRRIVSVDVTGNAAIGKIELDYPNAKLTDYMSLLKVGGEWKIVNKIFTAEPKPGGVR